MAQVVQLSRLERREPAGPGRRRLVFLFAVMGAPLAWSAQVAFNAAFAAYPCAPHSTLAVTAPITADADRICLFLVNLLAIVAAAVATGLAWQAWRGAEGRSEGSTASLVAERLTRTRYLAMWGLINGALFIGALVFDTVMLIGTPAIC